MTQSSENRVPTETFLLPGQQGFTVKPWEIAQLPRAADSLKLRVPPAPKSGSALDEPQLAADPISGMEIGACQVIRRLSPGSVKSLLGVRDDPREGAALVVLRKIEIAEGLEREITEHAQCARRFKHPNLARVFNPEVSDEGLFWVSEHTSGATLAELFDVCRKMGKGLPVGLVLGIVHEAASALAELHVPTQFSHGLICDQSLAISFDGTARLADVGLFKAISEGNDGRAAAAEPSHVRARQNAWGEVLETIGPYLAPEQLLKGYPPDAKCDVFSLAAVLYEALSGQKLARASGYDDRVKKQASTRFLPASSLNVSLGKQLDEVLATALSADRAMRYTNALEFAKALKGAVSAFIWRPELRAEFIGKLFETRKRREQVLLAGCAPKRSLTSPALAMPAIVLPLPVVVRPPPPPPPTPVAVIQKAAPQKKKKLKSSRLRPLALTLAACSLAWVAWGGMVPDDLDGAITWLGSAAATRPSFPSRIRGYGMPPPPAFVAVAPAAALPPMLPPEECSSMPPPPAAVEAVAAAEAPKPKPAARVVRKKRLAEELPSAPWLTPTKGRKNR